jgi:hypothetical protein
MAAEPGDRKAGNEKLVAARLRLASPSGSGEPMSTEDVADGMNAYLWEEHLRVKGSPEPTVLDHRFVSAYESGRFWWPSRHYRRAFRAVLKVATDADLGFHPNRKRRSQARNTPSSTTELDIPQPVPNTDPVQRRTLVVLLAGLAAGKAVDRAGLAQLVAGSDLVEPGTSLADHWQSVASEYGHSYLASPRQQTMRDLAIDLAILELTLPRATSEAARRALHEAGARISALLAMACTDLGYGPEARHSWLLARRLSNASESADVQLWVRGQEALLGIYSGRPLVIIERLTTNSLVSTVESRSSGTADLLAAQAETYALQGRTSEALTTLGTLKRAFDRLPDPVITEVDSVYRWPEHRLRHTESFVHSVVGSTRDATRAQDLALKLYPPSRSVSRCQIEMHRSVSLVRGGDVVAGIRHATSELASLSPVRRGRFVLAVAGHIASAIPATEARRPEAQDFRAYLSDLGLPD